MGKMSTNFDFLSNLHKVNPVAFDEYRKDVIDEHIDSLPDDQQERAREFQNQIDEVMSHCENPSERIESIATLLSESTSQLGDAMDSLASLTKKHV